MARDEFSSEIKRTLAHRAGFLCSKCRAPTGAGADTDPAKTVSIGVAAHMAAAAAGGPRYDPGMSVDERRAPSNGIWLCATCATLIDRNAGADFPIDVLRGWKTDAETSAQANLGKPPAPQLTVVSGTIEAHGIGEVTGAHLTKPTIIAAGTHISASGIGRITGVKN